MESEEIRSKYAYDPTLHATVIPSGKAAASGGGSYAFDSNNPAIPQNIVVCEDNTMRTVAVVDPAVMRKTASKVLPSSETVEAAFVGLANLDASKKVDEPPIVNKYVRSTEIPTRQQVDEIQEIPAPKLDGAPAPRSKAVPVTIKGPFGKIRQSYSSVFRDGSQFILMARNDELGTTYELPEIDEEAITLEVKVNNKVLTCIWAGIQFTLPDDSVTFTVLLIADEHDLDG